MKAARYYGKHDLRVEDMAAPDAPGPGQVIVAPSFCGICGTDLHEYESGPIFTSTTPNGYSGAALPQILGHEFAGRVVAVGPGVTRLQPGQRVSIQPQMGPRDDYYGRRNLCYLGPMPAVVGLSYPWGGMAGQALVPAENAIPMPDSITDQQGALVEPAAVVVHAMDRSGIQPGGSILITGAGPIGALMVLAAKAAGASRIFVSEPSAGRRARIAALGIATAIFDPREPGFIARLRAETEESVGVDAAMECAGNEQALQACIAATRAQGVVVQVGLMGRPAQVDTFDLVVRDITLRGSMAYPATLWPRVFEMMASGLLPAERVVDAEIPLAEVVEGGFRVLADPAGAKLKILIGLQG